MVGVAATHFGLFAHHGSQNQPHLRKRKREPTVALSATETSPGRDDLSPTTRTSPLEPSYLGRSDYLDTHVPIDEADASQYQRFSENRPATSISEDRLPTLDDVLPRSTRESFLSSFLKRCWPWMPLLEPSSIRAMFDSNPRPTFLMMSILTAGSKVSKAFQAAELGELCYRRAKSLFHSGAEDDILNAIVGTVFLQWWNQTGPEHISMDNSSFWLRMGVALAHQTGLHRQPDSRDHQSQLRRKLWWTLVSRDCQIATSHGRPRAINLQDSSVRPLDPRDFVSFDEDAQPFISFVQITQILGDLTQSCLRGDLTQQRRIEIESSLLSWLRNLPRALHLFNRDTHQLNPYSIRSRQLHLPYFVSLIILFRQAAPEKCPSSVSILAAGFITGIFEEYLDWGDLFFVSPASIFYLLVGSLLQVSSHRFQLSVSTAGKETRITDQAIEQLKVRFHTAFGAERVIKATRRLATAGSLSSQPVQLHLDPYHEDFFSSFGPGLCSQWDTMFRSSPAQANIDGAHVMDLLSSADPNNTMAPDGTWSTLAPESHALTDDFLSLPEPLDWTSYVPYVNTNQFETNGQWWWTDHVP
ncbi:hypothetical protein LTR92_001278 [Exophiala xenobiotica]|nr:hypothetical protein LTR92_001278 [Exophiala xenobiotica]